MKKYIEKWGGGVTFLKAFVGDFFTSLLSKVSNFLIH